MKTRTNFAWQMNVTACVIRRYRLKIKGDERMPRSPLTEKFLRIVALRDEVKSWPQDEQDFFLDMLVPQPTNKPQKKSSKKAAGGGKSKRGESLKGQLDSRRQEQRKVTGDDDDSGCDHIWQTGELAGLECGAGVDANVHQLTTTEGYHKFVAPPASSAAGSGG